MSDEDDLTGAQPKPLDKALLDYHNRWQRWCWVFRELTRDRPGVTNSDDHDVYHGNVWVAGGQHAKRQDDGGYKLIEFFEDDVLELYDLRSDIGETANLSERMPERANCTARSSNGVGTSAPPFRARGIRRTDRKARPRNSG